jgi:amino-acid N-acetyltransferase
MGQKFYFTIRPVIVRRAKITDVGNIVSFVKSLSFDGTLLERSHEDVEANIDTFIIAENEEKQFLGCISLYCYGPNLAEIRSVAVHPDARGQGIGHLLMKAILQKADEHGIECLCLFTRIPDYFLSFNFCTVSRQAIREKYYKDCHSCSRRQHCNEIAMIRGELKHIPFVRQISTLQGLVQLHP